MTLWIFKTSMHFIHVTSKVSKCEISKLLNKQQQSLTKQKAYYFVDYQVYFLHRTTQAVWGSLAIFRK
jgi:hypothetical protein